MPSNLAMLMYGCFLWACYKGCGLLQLVTPAHMHLTIPYTVYVREFQTCFHIARCTYGMTIRKYMNLVYLVHINLSSDKLIMTTVLCNIQI